MMLEEPILDDFKGDNSEEIQESFEYRMLLTLLWLAWSVLLFYDGSIELGFIIEGPSGLFTFFPHRMETVYEYYLVGLLTLGMAIVILKQSKDRIFYLFSFFGIVLLLLFDLAIQMGGLLVFLPMVILLFLQDIRACLICYILSSLLFVLIASRTFGDVEYMFIYPRFLITYSLIFMSGLSYRAVLFPLKEVKVKLQYRLSLLLGFLPSTLEYFF